MLIDLETFRKLLVKQESNIFSLGDIIELIDPKKIFENRWETGLPVLEVYSRYSSKELIKISKRIRDLYKYTVELSFEAPSNNNPQDIILAVTFIYAKKLFSIMCAITFENPEILKELPESWVNGISEVNKDSNNFPYIMEKLLMPTLSNLRNKQSLDRYTRKNDRKTIDKFIISHDDFFNKVTSPTEKLLPEEYIIGWFKELRENKVDEKWVEDYLRSIKVPSYTADDLKLILICADIETEENLSIFQVEEVFDLFWDNIDTIYENLFHQNISNTPIFVARVYVSMFLM